VNSQASIRSDYSREQSSGIGAFVFMMLAAIAICGLALYMGKAPFSAGLLLSDWLDWARIETGSSGMFVLGIVLFLLSTVGMVHRLILPKSAAPEPRQRAQKQATKPVQTKPSEEIIAPMVSATAAIVPMVAPHIVADNTRKASLKFEAETQDLPKAEAPVVSNIHLEPIAEAKVPEAEPLQSADIIPFRQEAETTQQVIQEAIADALLAETPDPLPVSDASKPSDINAVISSAMSFIESPDTTAQAITSLEEVHAARTDMVSDAEHTSMSTAHYKALSEALGEPKGESLMDSVVLEPQGVSASPQTIEPILDPQAEIALAVSSALTHWPDNVRDIAEVELSTRLSQLYHDNAITSREAFGLVKSGDLNGASKVISEQAMEWASAGLPNKAAELWRIFGALHMGRNDDEAMRAYEQVSNLDPSDANIHLYLFRRYQMNNDTERLRPVLSRALGVVGDTDTRAELLTPLADISQKSGDLRTAAQALEELSHIKAHQSIQAHDNLQLRSGHAITLARLAQVHEMLGEGQKAAPLYQHAHQVFSELSARVPDHAGLKAMAANALKDAQRLSA
jgi:tetratricopeptide (TPR) repeat protein